MSIRLINTETLRMEMFMGENVPPYAILSHTWVNNEEISLQQYEALFANPQDGEARRKSGYRKILKTCERAQAETPKLRYAWVDTCCIDKSSSAELQEAINSMYKWYCFLRRWLTAPSRIRFLSLTVDLIGISVLRYATLFSPIFLLMWTSNLHCRYVAGSPEDGVSKS
jgi:hypothetical protein